MQIKEAYKIPIIPPDIIKVENGNFAGTAYIFKGNRNNLQIAEVPFSVPVRQPVSPFRYYKPIYKEEDDPFGPPSEIKEEIDLRSGYYPLSLVKMRRPPNHMRHEEYALLMARDFGEKNNPKWETRWFPISCIENWPKVLAEIAIQLPTIGQDIIDSIRSSLETLQ